MREILPILIPALLVLFIITAGVTAAKIASINNFPVNKAKRLLDAFIQIKSVEYTHGDQGVDYCIQRAGSTVSIYFQGSHGTEDWLHNFDFFARPYKDMADTWRVHRGFLKVWKAVEDIVGEQIQAPEIDTIKIAGYSHGGALAQFCHEYCRYHRPDCSVQTFAFGAPRIIFGHIPGTVRRRFRGCFIIRNGLDIVPHLPFVFLGFHHVGRTIDVGAELHPTRSHLHYREVLADIIETH